jgi:hypothetical protein
VCQTLFCYLEKTNDIDTTIQWYNKREDIQSIELTEIVKSCIKANFLKPKVSFISRASDYLLLLGNDFIYNVTKEYLQKTHKSEPLLKQLSHSKEGYREKLSSLLFSFHHDYRDLVDDNFVEPLCRYTYKDIHSLLTEDFIVEALEALVDNTKNYKNALFYAGKFSPEAKNRIENYLLSLLSNEEYMHLWEEELCNYLPDSYLDFYFDSPKRDIFLNINIRLNSYNISVLKNDFEIKGYIIDKDSIDRIMNGEYILLKESGSFNGNYIESYGYGFLQIQKEFNKTNISYDNINDEQYVITFIMIKK